jgi:chorismate dehydratase
LQTKIRVGAVSYLNTKPLIYGFEHGMMEESVDLKIDFPSKIATMLLEDQIDVGLVPVAVIPEMKEHHIISDYCIGCDGEVASVCLFSEVPLENVSKILLDYQSRTSVELLKIIIKEYWKIDPVLEQPTEEYTSRISGTTAALLIGDRALRQRKNSAFMYDLGLEWKKFTGLPFVFAAWVSNKALSDAFIESFNSANAYGLNNLHLVLEANLYNFFELEDYYTKYINYRMDAGKQIALKRFFKKLELMYKLNEINI